MTCQMVHVLKLTYILMVFFHTSVMKWTTNSYWQTRITNIFALLSRNFLICNFFKLDFKRLKIYMPAGQREPKGILQVISSLIRNIAIAYTNNFCLVIFISVITYCKNRSLFTLWILHAAIKTWCIEQEIHMKIIIKQL